MDTLFTVLHVVAGVFVVGPMAILPMTGMRAIRVGNAGAVATLAASTRVFTLASIVVALLGFAVVGMSKADDHFTVGTPWILSSIIIYVVALGLSLVLVVPALRASASLLSSNATADTKALYSRVAMGSGIVAVLLLAIVVLMVWQP